jgi:hypothetical protein
MRCSWFWITKASMPRGGTSSLESDKAPRMLDHRRIQAFKRDLQLVLRTELEATRVALEAKLDVIFAELTELIATKLGDKNSP